MGPSGEPGAGPPATYWQVPAPAPPTPVPGTRHGPVATRFAALLIDLLPLGLVGLVLYLPALSALLGPVLRVLPASDQAPAVDPAVLQAAMADGLAAFLPSAMRAGIIVQLLGMGYFVGSWLILGRSPGMALLGLRIVTDDGGPIGLGRVIVRFAGYVIGALPLLLGFAWALWDPRKQAWHDKLAGTVVLSESRLGVAPPTVPGATGPPSETGGGSTWSPSPRARRRPAMGALAEQAWASFRRGPRRLLWTLAPVLMVGFVVLVPLLVLVMDRQQTELIVSFQSIVDAMRSAPTGDLSNVDALSLAAAVPVARASAGVVLAAWPIGAVLLAICAASVDPLGQLRPAGDAWRAVLARLPAFIGLGLVAGALTAVYTLLLVLPGGAAAAAAATSSSVADSAALGILVALTILPFAALASALVPLAVVCIVREQLDVLGALARAWSLAQGHLRWLVGLVVVGYVAAGAMLGPIESLPIAVLGGAYLAGSSLPVVLCVVVSAIVSLAAAPLVGFLALAAYQALRR
jgi:uncharacterized RDD family membrane protein YckC